MHKIFKQLFLKDLAAPDKSNFSEHDYQLATSVLLIETARADTKIGNDELKTINKTLQKTFKLDVTETTALMELAGSEVEHATSLHIYTSALNKHLSNTQKTHLVELLWLVAFSDGHIDRYEDHFVRKIADLLHLKHSLFIKAKHKMQQLSVQLTKGH